MRCLHAFARGESFLQPAAQTSVPQFLRNILQAEECIQGAVTDLRVRAHYEPTSYMIVDIFTRYSA